MHELGAASESGGSDLYHADLIYYENLQLVPLCIIFMVEHRSKIFCSLRHAAPSKRVESDAIDADGRYTCMLLCQYMLL
jgi:hypothetical protein